MLSRRVGHVAETPVDALAIARSDERQLPHGGKGGAEMHARNTLYCSFCGKTQHEVRRLIAGPTVFICDECIELCMQIILEERGNPARQDQPRESAESWPAHRPGDTAVQGAQVPIALIDPRPLPQPSLEMLAKTVPDFVTAAFSSCEELFEARGEWVGWPRLVIIHTTSAGLAEPWVQNTLDRIRWRMPDVPVVVLCGRDDVDEISKALTHGVRGYIPMSVDAEVVSAALRIVIAGGTYIPAAPAKPDIGSDRNQPEPPPGNLLVLTPRELAVVALLREGKPNRLIAAELKMQESTVEVHVRNILKKLRVTNRTHAAFVSNRLLNHPPPATLPLPQSASETGPTSSLEERLAILKTQLKIADVQMALWESFARAVRNSAEAIAVLHRGIDESETAALPERLAKQEMDILARLDALRQWKAVVGPFYVGLSREQRQRADELLMRLFRV